MIVSDLIRRQDAIHAIEDMPNAYNGWSDTYDKACIIGVLEELPSAETQPITCDGCKHVGTYDTDFPCSGCIRREKDYYEPEE